MNRRTFLGGAGTSLIIALAGCTGSSSDSSPYTRAPNTAEIRKSIPELLLTREQLGTEWTSVPRPRENEVEFETKKNGTLHVVNAWVWVAGTIKKAKENYENQLSEFQSPSTSVDLAVDAVRYTVATKAEILFRDANAIGRLKYAYFPEAKPTSVDATAALQYAKLLYANFR